MCSQSRTLRFNDRTSEQHTSAASGRLSEAQQPESRQRKGEGAQL